MNNRKRLTFVAVFGVLALALIGFFAYWPPSVQNEQATGAIGAVKKHSAPQITSQDVVLSDEATRLEEKILYVDYISDAKKLQSFSDALASRGDLAAIETQLASHQADIQNRFVQSFSDALESMKSLQGRNVENRSNGNREALEALAQDFQNRSQGNRSLGHADMEALNQRFADLASRSIGSRDLASREADLGAIESQLESAKTNLESRNADLASKSLEAIRQQFGAMDQAESRSLEASRNYLGALTLQQRVVGEAREQLGGGARTDFGAISNTLASEANNLENRAINNMDARFQSRVDLANRFDQMNRSLGSMRAFASRENLGSRADMFSRSLGSLQQDLQSREADIANRIAAGSRSELQALNQLLSRSIGNRDQMESRSIGNRDQMESRSIGNRDQVESRSVGNRDQVESRSLGSRDQMESRSLGNRDQMESRTLANAQRYLDNVNRNLGSMKQIANRDQLQAAAADMASRVDLASRSVGSRGNN